MNEKNQEKNRGGFWKFVVATIFLLAAIVAIISFVENKIPTKPDVKPKSSWLPKKINSNDKLRHFDIEIMNGGNSKVTYRLVLNSSFINFEKNNNEQDPAYADFRSYQVALYPKETHKHNISFKNMHKPEKYGFGNSEGFFNSNAYIELKIFEQYKDGNLSKEPIYQAKCYYDLSINENGLVEIARYNRPLLDTSGQSEKEAKECGDSL